MPGNGQRGCQTADNLCKAALMSRYSPLRRLGCSRGGVLRLGGFGVFGNVREGVVVELDPIIDRIEGRRVGAQSRAFPLVPRPLPRCSRGQDLPGRLAVGRLARGRGGGGIRERVSGRCLLERAEREARGSCGRRTETSAVSCQVIPYWGSLNRRCTRQVQCLVNSVDSLRNWSCELARVLTPDTTSN